MHLGRKGKRLILLGVAMMVLVPLLLTLPRSGRASVCDCVDIGDIMQRLAEVGAAIAAYSAQMAKIVEVEEGGVTRDVPFSSVEYAPILKAQVQAAVQKAIQRTVQGRKSAGAKGDTDNACNITNNGKTPCMRESVQRHEEVHRQACLSTRDASSMALAVLGDKRDRFLRDGFTMGQFIMEEIRGYQAEVTFLTQELAELEKRCKKPKEPEPVLSRYPSVEEKLAAREAVEEAAERVSLAAEGTITLPPLR
jgi:hypothetical protein